MMQACIKRVVFTKEILYHIWAVFNELKRIIFIINSDTVWWRNANVNFFFFALEKRKIGLIIGWRRQRWVKIGRGSVQNTRHLKHSSIISPVLLNYLSMPEPIQTVVWIGMEKYCPSLQFRGLRLYLVQLISLMYSFMPSFLHLFIKHVWGLTAFEVIVIQI